MSRRFAGRMSERKLAYLHGPPSPPPRWTKEMWQMAAENKDRHPLIHLVLICDSSVYTSVEKLQELLGQPLESKWGTRRKDGEFEEDPNAEKVQCCEVTSSQWDQLQTKRREKTETVWYNGKHRRAYLFTALPPEKASDTEDSEPPNLEELKYLVRDMLLENEHSRAE